MMQPLGATMTSKLNFYFIYIYIYIQVTPAHVLFINNKINKNKKGKKECIYVIVFYGRVNSNQAS